MRTEPPWTPTRDRGRRCFLRRVVIVAVVGLVPACGSTPQRDLVVGECLSAAARVVGVREPDPPTVPCSGPHRYEVVGVGRPLSGPWPGQEVVDGSAERWCVQRLRVHTGRDLAGLVADGVDLVYLAPAEGAWDTGDRTVECVIRWPQDRSGTARDEGGVTS